MKTVLKYILLIVVFSLIGIALYYIPYERILNKIPYLNKQINKTAVTVTLKNGVGEVFVDGESYGSTPASITGIPVGQHKLTIKKTAEPKDAYQPFDTYVTLTNGTETTINLDIAPAGKASGVVLFYTPSTNRNKSSITFEPSVNTAKLLIDNRTYQYSLENNVIYLAPQEYEVRIEAPGYEPVTYPVIVREGFNLHLQAYLLPLPILIEEVTE